MESFERSCVLWPPHDRDAAMGGTLRFDHTSGVSAELIGSLHPDEPMASIFEPPTDDELTDPVVEEEEIAGRDPGAFIPVLYGVVQGKLITLLNVQRTEGSAATPGHARDLLSPQVAICGEHLSDGLDTLVSSLAVSFDVLADWYDTTLGDQRPPTRVTTHSSERVNLVWPMPTPLQATLASGDVVLLATRQTRHETLREFRLDLSPEFYVCHATPIPLSDAISVLTPLRWLTSLVTRQPARIASLRATAAGDARQTFDIVFRSTEPRGARRCIHPYEMALKLPDFNLPTVLPRWMDMVERLRTPMALLFANWFSPGLYAENRVLNVATAAESLARLLHRNQRTELSDRADAVEQFVNAFPVGEQALLRSRLAHVNDPSLRDRLHELVADAGEAFDLLDVDATRWIGQVVRARNGIAHGALRIGDALWLRAVAQTLEHLIEARLFIELGMTASQVERALRDTPRTAWITKLAAQHIESGTESGGGP